jgi:hypothetical protein
MHKMSTVSTIKHPPISKLKTSGVAAVAVLLLLMVEPTAVIASMQQSLSLCAGTVVPSLFPFLAASELLVRSGAGERIARAKRASWPPL